MVRGPAPNYYFAEVTQNNQISNTDINPCLFLNIPGTFQCGVVFDFNQNSLTANESSTNTTFVPNASFNSQAGNGTNWVALYKWEIPLSGPGDPHPLTFNNGILLGATNSQGTHFFTDVTTPSPYQILTSQSQIGIGLERAKDFMVGFQWNEDSTDHLEQYIPGNFQAYSVSSSNRISLGGERWISETCALRIGLTYEDDQNSGGPGGATEGFFQINPYEDVSGLQISAGAGYERGNFKGDGMIWLEPSSITPTHDSPFISGLGMNGSCILFGIQANATFFFDM